LKGGRLFKGCFYGRVEKFPGGKNTRKPVGLSGVTQGGEWLGGGCPDLRKVSYTRGGGWGSRKKRRIPLTKRQPPGGPTKNRTGNEVALQDLGGGESPFEVPKGTSFHRKKGGK